MEKKSETIIIIQKRPQNKSDRRHNKTEAVKQKAGKILFIFLALNLQIK